MKKLLLAAGLAAVLLTGCDALSFGETTPEDNSEASTLGIDTTQRNWMNNLTDNTFYIVHNDTYYPLYSYLKNYRAENYEVDIDRQVDTEKQFYYTTENEKNIPTLYEGDKLVYYSTSALLPYISWERYYDMGYTIGVTNIQTDIGGRCFVDLTDTDNFPLLPDNELYELQKENASSLLLDKIGGTQITPDMIDNGLLMGTEKDTQYDIDVYVGTYYKYFSTTSNYHAFRAFELYASVDYKTMQDYIYEIDIPDYILTGYYNINDKGLLRLVRGKTYDDYTDFNEKLLYQSDGNYDPDDPEYVYTYTPPYCYSDYEPLNKYKTDIMDAFGYVDPELEEASTEETDNGEEKTHKAIQESIKKSYAVLLPKGKECKFKVESPSGEKTGRISVVYEDGKTASATFNFIDKTYELTVNGNGEVVTFIIEGFYNGYDVTLTNAEMQKEIIEQPEQQKTEATTQAPATEETSQEADAQTPGEQTASEETPADTIQMEEGE